MTDPWCCYIWCAMDPIKINPLYVSIFIPAPAGSVMGYGKSTILRSESSGSEPRCLELNGAAAAALFFGAHVEEEYPIIKTQYHPVTSQTCWEYVQCFLVEVWCSILLYAFHFHERPLSFEVLNCHQSVHWKEVHLQNDLIGGSFQTYDSSNDFIGRLCWLDT